MNLDTKRYAEKLLILLGNKIFQIYLEFLAYE